MKTPLLHARAILMYRARCEAEDLHQLQPGSAGLRRGDSTKFPALSMEGWLMLRMRHVAIAFAAALALGAGDLRAQDKLVVSIWGGNWKDGADKVIAAEFKKRTAMNVEFITGGTMDRLTKAKVAKGNP